MRTQLGAGKRLLTTLFLVSLALPVFAQNAPLISTPGTGKFDWKSGADLYRSNCQGCHMADGKGAQGAGMYPSLYENANLETASYVLKVVTEGLNGMPGFRRQYSDQQIVEVVTYVRTHFGNRYTEKVDAAEIPR